MTNLTQFGDMITPPFFDIRPTPDSSIISGSYFFGVIIKYAIICLASTIIIELVVALIMGIRGKDLWKIVLAQVVTNPPLVFISNFILYELTGVTPSASSLYLLCVVILEVIAVMVEYWIYKNSLKNSQKHSPLTLSIISNIVSFVVGIMLLGLY